MSAAQRAATAAPSSPARALTSKAVVFSLSVSVLALMPSEAMSAARWLTSDSACSSSSSQQHQQQCIGRRVSIYMHSGATHALCCVLCVPSSQPDTSQVSRRRFEAVLPYTSVSDLRSGQQQPTIASISAALLIAANVRSQLMPLRPGSLLPSPPALAWCSVAPRPSPAWMRLLLLMSDSSAISRAACLIRSLQLLTPSACRVCSVTFPMPGICSKQSAMNGCRC